MGPHWVSAAGVLVVASPSAVEVLRLVELEEVLVVGRSPCRSLVRVLRAPPARHSPAGRFHSAPEPFGHLLVRWARGRSSRAPPRARR